MMSLLISFLARRSVALPALVALSLLGAGSPTRAADEPDSGGTFNAPGYPPRTMPQGTQGAGGAGNAPNAQSRGNVDPRGNGSFGNATRDAQRTGSRDPYTDSDR